MLEYNPLSSKTSTKTQLRKGAKSSNACSRFFLWAGGFSEGFDKFIEVKSCSDDRWIFFISRNELEVAKNKQDSYLYLFHGKGRKGVMVNGAASLSNQVA